MQKLEEFLLPETEELRLPSGLKVVLRPPNKLEFFAAMGLLPGRLANALTGEKPAEPTPEELVEKTYRLMTLVVVEPRLALPQPDHIDPVKMVQPPGTIHPRRLRDADRKAIDDWASKYLDLGGGGADLESFRKKASGPAPAAGASGGDVPPAPQPDPERHAA